jgi:lipoate---protein ligase
MERVVTEKVPGGKLVRIKVDCNDTVMNSIQITGDFFLHPEYAIEQLESALIGITREQDPIILHNIIATILANNNAQFVGVTIGDLVRLIKEATK